MTRPDKAANRRTRGQDMAETMTKEQKRAATDLAWASYRAETQRIPNLPWDEYLDADERAWRRYLGAERSIAAIPETKAA